MVASSIATTRALPLLLKPAARPLVARAVAPVTASIAQPAVSSAAAAFIQPLAALPLAVRDPLCTVALVVASVIWIKLCKLVGSQYVSRKLVHMGSGPLFILFWPIFSTTPSGQIAACLVPVISVLRLLRAGSRTDGGQADLINAVSRSGDKKEALEGPMVYTLVLLASTLFGWRKVVSAVAVCQMAIGDGMADIIGRRFGKTRWPTWLEASQKKSVEGSVAFVFFAFLASFLFVALFQITGLTALAPFAVAPTLLLISVVTAIAELVDFGDDNLNVPLCAAALSILLL